MIDDCYEPKSEENCGNNFTKWFFDRSKMRCLQFTFTGCTKHKNNFDTREECEALCGSLRGLVFLFLTVSEIKKLDSKYFYYIFR